VCFVGERVRRARDPGRPVPAGREQLDNLIFVVNATSSASTARARQRKIIQSSSRLRARLERHQGHLGHLWTSCSPDVDASAQQDEHDVDGEFQKLATRRRLHPEHSSGRPRLRKLVEHLTDEDLRRLPGATTTASSTPYKRPPRHGPAHCHPAKTIKAGRWPDIESRNATHQIKENEHGGAEKAAGPPAPPAHIPTKPLSRERLTTGHPMTARVPYMMQRGATGGSLPTACPLRALPAPAEESFSEFDSVGRRQVSTTMAFAVCCAPAAGQVDRQTVVR